MPRRQDERNLDRDCAWHETRRDQQPRQAGRNERLA